jgi:hypothetical protein
MTPPPDRRFRERKGLGYDQHEALGRSGGLIGRLVGKHPATAGWPATIGRGVPGDAFLISAATKETGTSLGLVLEGFGQPRAIADINA